jgi:tetratricopeptide (TPR) repeat protein/predicted aspartyl protease
MHSKAFAFSTALVLATLSGHASAACQVVLYAELPVTMVGTQPLIAGSINGVDALFIADSGAFFSTLSRASAEKFKLILGPLPVGLEVRGVGGAADARMAKAKDFSLKGLGTGTFHNVEFVVGGNAFASRSAGVIGQNVLGRADTEYDLANGFIRLFHAKDCVNRDMAYWHGAADVAMIGIKYTSERSPHLIGTATLNGANIRVLFDTGAANSVLSLKAAAHAGFKPDGSDVIAGGVAQGIGRQFIETWIARFDSLSLGGEEIKNARLRVGAIDLLGDADMLLGADFFLSHRIYVAESQQKIFFTYNGGRVFDLSVTMSSNEAAAPAADAPPAIAGGEDPQKASMDAADLRRRGAASAGRRDFPSAIADFDQAIKLDPTDAESYYQRAMARWHEHQAVLAMADFDAALKIRPDGIPALMDRGALRLANKDDAGARADFDAIASLAPRDASLGLQIAEVYEHAGHFDEAINRFDSWIGANPKDDRMRTALSLRCWSRVAMNSNLDLALADCDAALKRGAPSSPFLDSRAMVWLRLGKFDKSIADFKTSLRLQPKSAWALYGLGVAEQKNGMKGQADKDMQTAIAITPAIAKEFKALGLAP